MARVRCNSFVETTCIPKRKLQEHITRIPPLRGIPDIGLILKYVLKYVTRMISCVSEVQLKHFQFTLSWSACDQFERLKKKGYKKQELITRKKFSPFIIYRRQRGVRCCGSNNCTTRRCQPSRDGSVSRRSPRNLTTVILTFELPKVCFCLFLTYRL